MPVDEAVVERVRSAMAALPGVREQRMFGGVAFLLRGNMCCGVVDDVLMARVGPDAYEDALALPHAREMTFTKRPMRGFVYVDPPGFAARADLARWVERCAEFARSLPAK